MNTTEYMRYEKSRMAYFENQAVLDTAFTEGEIKGKIEGKMEIVEAGFYEGWSIEFTAKITGIPVESVENAY